MPMDRRDFAKVTAMAVAGVSLPTALLRGTAPPAGITFAPTSEDQQQRHWTVLAPVPELGLEPERSNVTEWMPPSRFTRWTAGGPVGQRREVMHGPVWPLLVAAFGAGAVRLNMDAFGRKPDQDALIARFGAEGAIERLFQDRERQALASAMTWDNYLRAGAGNA